MLRSTILALTSVLSLTSIVALVLLAGCSTLPQQIDTGTSNSLPPMARGSLARAADAVAVELGNADAVLLLDMPEEALTWRLALLDSARTSIDIQYFTWGDGASGHLVLQRLWAAADRGVRVRLMLDDLYLISSRSFTSVDAQLAAINRHPNIQLKIFNPGKYRSGNMGVAGNFAGSFAEFNRRMHNKLLIADGRMAVLGGRNIDDEYFGLDEAYNFLDMDVLVTGPVIDTMRGAFDLYWNSEPAYPAIGFVNADPQVSLAQMRADNDAAVKASADKLQAFSAQPREWEELLGGLPARMHSAGTHFLQDTPNPNEDGRERLYQMIRNQHPPASSESIIVTPYLIPVGSFVDDVRELVESGVRVRLLTTSLASVNHSAVHAHYKKYRRDILATGVELYEFRHDPGPAIRARVDVPPVQSEFISLHVKASVSDRQRCFIGSLNLDPRALVVNTENGLVIRSKTFCGDLAEQLEILLQPDNAWRVTVDDQGQLEWTSSAGKVNVAPARSGGQRAADFLYRWLPLEGQL